MAFFGGIGAAASRGILFKGGNSFSPVAKATTAAFDKTGTLTAGEFSVKGVFENKIPEKELLSLCASVEQGSNHPIAKSICKSVGEYVPAENVKELAGKGTIGSVSGFRIAVGNKLLMEEEGACVPKELEKSDETYVFCARSGEFVGAILISDELKPEAKNALKMLRKVGIKKTVILSGDKKARADKIGRELSVDEVRAELLPEEKFSELEKIIEEADGKTMYVGDGINDAPSLTRADVGVAMGGIGSDSAIEASDLVIMSDNLEKLPEAVKIAQKTLLIAKENIVFAIGVKLLIMVLGAFGIANMWLAVFADVGVAVIAILNSMRTLIAGKRGRL
jgi:Cd2+/Zn2+-exporting ATPase